jgi:hypothetical protein
LRRFLTDPGNPGEACAAIYRLGERGSRRLLTDAEYQSEDEHESDADCYGTHSNLEFGSVIEPICIDTPASVPAVVAGVDRRYDGKEQDDRDPGPDKRS